MRHSRRKAACLCLMLVLLFSTAVFASSETLTSTVPGLNYSYSQTMNVTYVKAEGSISCSNADYTSIGVFMYYYKPGNPTGAYWDGENNYSAYNSNMSTYTYVSWNAPTGAGVGFARYRSYVNGTKTRATDMFVLP